MIDNLPPLLAAALAAVLIPAATYVCWIAPAVARDREESNN